MNLRKNCVINFAQKHEFKTFLIVERLMHNKIVEFNDYNLLNLRDKYK